MPCNTHEDADAYEAVLEFLYKNQLPVSPTVSLLSKMITAADYLGSDLCLKACVHSLSNLPVDQYSILHVWNIIKRQRGCSALDQTAVLKMEAALGKGLLDVYGNVLSIIGSKDLLLTFCQLPITAIEAWGKSDKLIVDSENSIVVLLNNWWRSQSRRTRSVECMRKLSGLVRPVYLSSGYLHHVLDSLEWFGASSPLHDVSVLKLACTVLNTEGVVNVTTENGPYSWLNITKRKSASEKRLKLEWRIPYQQLQSAVVKATGHEINGTEKYWQGHNWRLYLRVDPGDDNVNVWICVRRLAACTMPKKMSVFAKVEIQGQLFGVQAGHHIFTGGQGWGAAKQFKQQNAMNELQTYFTSGNHLEITAFVSNVH